MGKRILVKSAKGTGGLTEPGKGAQGDRGQKFETELGQQVKSRACVTEGAVRSYREGV